MKNVKQLLNYSFIFTLILGLAACGGGNDSNPVDQNVSALCSPAIASPSDPISCQTPSGFEDGCTCFFVSGQSPSFTRTPVTCHLDEQRHLYLAPMNRAGTYRIEFQCGDQAPRTVAENYNVRVGVTQNPTSCTSSMDCTSGYVCQTGVCVQPPYIPSNTTGGQSTAGQTAPVDASLTRDSDADDVSDHDDLCPYTVPGTIVDDDGCPARVSLDRDNDGIPDAVDRCLFLAGDTAHAGCPADIEAALPRCTPSQVIQDGRCVDEWNRPTVDLTLTALTPSGPTQPGTVRLNWSITNLPAVTGAYLYGGSGTACDRFVTDRYSAPTSTRADACQLLTNGECLTDGEVTSRAVPSSQIVMVGSTPRRLCRTAVTTLAGEIHTVAPRDTAGSAYSLYKVYVPIPAANRGSESSRVSMLAERTYSASFPAPAISNIQVQFSRTEPKYDVIFSYTSVNQAPEVNCGDGATPATLPVPSSSGSGSVRKTCLYRGNQEITLAVRGVGGSASKTLNLNCTLLGSLLNLQANKLYSAATGGTELCVSASSPTCTQEGWVELEATVTRSCQVLDTEGNREIVSAQIPWGLRAFVGKDGPTSCLTLDARGNDSFGTGAPNAIVGGNPPMTITSSPTTQSITASFKTRLQRTFICHQYSLLAEFQRTNASGAVIGGEQSGRGLNVPYNVRTQFSMNDGTLRDWRYDLSTNDQDDSGWDDSFCPLIAREGASCAADGSNDNHRYRCTNQPLNITVGGRSGYEALIDYSVEDSEDINCSYKDSQYDGINFCGGYRLKEPVITFTSTNVARIEARCCQWGEGNDRNYDLDHAVGASFPESCSVDNLLTGSDATRRGMGRGMKYTLTRTATPTESHFEWKPTLSGERIRCVYRAFDSTGTEIESTRAGTIFSDWRRPTTPGACDRTCDGCSPSNGNDGAEWWDSTTSDMGWGDIRI